MWKRQNMLIFKVMLNGKTLNGGGKCFERM